VIADTLIAAMQSAMDAPGLAEWWRDNMAVIKMVNAEDRARVIAAKEARKIAVEGNDTWVDDWANGRLDWQQPGYLPKT
jgi:hypothetical protein